MDNKKTEKCPREEQKKPQPEALPVPEERDGVQGLDPTRYGDWQHKGRVSDF